MKLMKLATISAAVLASTAALAAEPVVYEAAPAYNADAGVVRNTTGAVLGGTKTLFQTATNPAAVSAEIGTLGYGASVAWAVNDKTELQAGWSGMNFDGDRDLDASDSWINWDKALGDGYGNYKGTMDYDVDFSNPYIGVQMRPFANNFTVAAGTMVPRNKINTTITADADSVGVATVSIDGTDYQVDRATIRAENKNKLAPYATIGYRPSITQNWGLFGELGAAYMGKLDAEVTNVVADDAEGFKAAAEKDIEDKNVWYPIVKVGATYRF